MTGTAENGYFALFLRSASHEKIIKSGNAHVTVFAGPGLYCVKSQVTLEVNLRDKGDGLLGKLKDLLAIDAPLEQLQLHELTCDSEHGISTHVLGKNEPLLSRMLKHLLAHINSDSIRFSVYHKRAAHRALDVTDLVRYVPIFKRNLHSRGAIEFHASGPVEILLCV